MFVRAAWLQGVRAERSSGWPPDSTGDDRRPRRPRRDVRPHRSPARDRAPGDDGLREPAADPRSRGDRSARRQDAEAGSGGDSARALRSVERLRLHRAQGRSRARREPEAGGHRRARLPGRGAARLSAERTSPRRCSATRASTIAASRASSWGSRRCSPARTGSETIIRDPTGRAIDILSSTAARGRSERLAHDRPLDPGAGRGRVAADDRPLPGAGARRRSSSTRATAWHPRDGGRARVRREPLPCRPQGPAAQPGRHGHVRAGLDVQARDGRARRCRRGSSRRTPRSRCRTRSRSRTGSSTTRTPAGRSG